MSLDTRDPGSNKGEETRNSYRHASGIANQIWWTYSGCRLSHRCPDTMVDQIVCRLSRFCLPAALLIKVHHRCCAANK